MDVLITLYDCIGTIYEAGDTYHSTHLISLPIFIYVMNYVVGFLSFWFFFCYLSDKVFFNHFPFFRPLFDKKEHILFLFSTQQRVPTVKYFENLLICNEIYQIFYR